MTGKDIASASAITRNLTTSESARRTDCCESCGASLRSSRLSVGEMAANAVCGILLLTACTRAFYIAEKWLDHNGHELFDPPVWHEPLDSWSF
jgi:hypothetical protein